MTNPFIPRFSFVPKTRTRGKKPTGFGSLIRDYDRDGVPNIIDCAPKNPKKHSVLTAVAGSILGSLVAGYAIRRFTRKK